MFPPPCFRVVTARFALVPLLALACLGPLARPAFAEPAEKSAAALLPASTLAYVEITRPKGVIDQVLDSPVRKLVEQSPDFRKALQSDQYKQFLAVVDLVETKTSLKWRPALETITGGGIVVAFDPATQGLIILVKSQDPKTTDSVRDALFSLVRDDAISKNNPDPSEPKDYRGLSAWKLGEAYVANVGPWLLISNKAAAAKGVADQFLDGGDSLADEKEFAQARSLAIDEARKNEEFKKAPTAWGYVRLAPLRLLGIARQLIDNKDKSDNPAAELLLGGILSDLRKSPFVAASLDVNKNGVELSLATPFNSASVAAERKYYFAPAPPAGGGQGGADAPLLPKGTLLSVSTYRDLPAFWQAAPDLFDEGVAGKFAQGDSGFSTFLGGKSFSADIIGAIRPEIQVIAARQDYNAQGVRGPSIRLPAFATVFRLKAGQSKTVRKAFRLAFQTIIAFGNVDGASKNRPALETASETRGGAEILYANYEADDPDKTPEKAGEKPAGKAASGVKDDTYLNFSPAIVLSDKYLVLASTRHIAEDLADLTAEGGKAADDPAAHTLISADGSLIGQILHENREQLIAQNMLEKGHDRPQAERDVDGLISLVEAVKSARVRITQNDQALRLEIGVRTGERGQE